jgi:two-component system CheB/CheR fusion protein
MRSAPRESFDKKSVARGIHRDELSSSGSPRIGACDRAAAGPGTCAPAPCFHRPAPILAIPARQSDEELAINTTPTPATGEAAADRPPTSMDERQAREWLWTFAEQSQDFAVVLLDLRFTVLWANPAAARIFGTSLARMIGEPMHRFFTDQDVSLGIPEHEIAVAISEGASEDDRWMTRGDGSSFWASGRSVALSGGDGAVVGFLKILRNDTDMKMRLVTLSNRVAALEQTEHDRTIALATLSHELRNPLSALNMAASLIERQADDPRWLQPVEIIQRNVGYVARMMDDLEQATRVTVGKLALSTEPLSLRQEIESAVQIALARAGNPPRNVQLLLPPGEPIRLEADRLRLQQVVANLVGNAIKFTADGGTIWIKGTSEGQHAVVRVEDDGAGIAPDMLDTIFRMFTQVDGQQQAGLGIGLALVKDIVERHGGTVQAKSDGPGKGSQFTVRLPLHPAGGPDGQDGSELSSGSCR